MALPLISLAGAVLVLGQGGWRRLALLPALAGVALWAAADRPLLLIAADGGLVGVMGPEGRALSAARGDGFAAQNWLENDGDLADQKTAAARPGMAGPEGARKFGAGGIMGIALKGRGTTEALSGACAAADFVVIAAKVEAGPPDCLLFDTSRLEAMGALALYPVEGGKGLRVVSTLRPARRWSAPARAVAPALIGPARRDEPLRLAQDGPGQ